MTCGPVIQFFQFFQLYFECFVEKLTLIWADICFSEACMTIARIIWEAFVYFTLTLISHMDKYLCYKQEKEEKVFLKFQIQVQPSHTFYRKM